MCLCARVCMHAFICDAALLCCQVFYLAASSNTFFTTTTNTVSQPKQLAEAIGRVYLPSFAYYN